MMALARVILSAFQDFLDDPAGVLSDDAANHFPRDVDRHDMDDPARTYLSDGALPDPGRTALSG